jgi:hypothetical protein
MTYSVHHRGDTVSWRRWLPTFLAFPLGGLLAVHTVGAIDGPLSAAAGGALAGAIIGAGQWLALRSYGIGARWIVYTAAAMAGGSSLATFLTGAGSELQDLLVAGVVAGAAVGAAQARLLRRDVRTGVSWAATTSVAWAAGWLATWSIGVDVESRYIVFGAAGAVVVTVLTGVVLRRIAAWSASATVTA